jgi:uncharacterized protein YndB with AHSA1/START domain
MKIDSNAPLSAKKEIEIIAPVEKVWALLTGIDDWPRWQPDVTRAGLRGDLTSGVDFEWNAKGVNITSTIKQIVPRQIIGWTGKSIGMKAIHLWKFEPKGGSTHVTTEESLSGWLPGLIRVFDPAFLDKSLTGSLLTLKHEAEKERGA